MESVEKSEKVLAGLRAWSGEGGDGRLTVGEDIDVGQPRGARHDVEREDCADDPRLENRVLTLSPQVLCPHWRSHALSALLLKVVR